AQAGHVAMPLSRQLVMMLTLMLTSKGVAGVSRASLVILAGALAGVGPPLQDAALILGVDVFMGTARTTVHRVVDFLAAAGVARWEGELVSPGFSPQQTQRALDGAAHGDNIPSA